MDQDTQLWKKNTSAKHGHDKIVSFLYDFNANEFISSRSKLAQEAIAGWEKADAEVVLRKQELSEELQEKIAERASFYYELKDRILLLSYAREEQDRKVHEALIKASKELEKKYVKLEGKYVESSRIVADLTLENSQLTKALQEKERLFNDAREEISQEAREVNILKAKQDSVEKENTVLRYRLQMLEKDLDIRNEELDLSRRSADALEKKYLDSANKIRRLESECHSLRVLVRKRLPGPTAFTKMKSEVKAQKRVPRGVPDRRISIIMERACDVEEENKILKEIAGNKDEELCSLRTAFALLNSKLSQVEDQQDSDMTLMDCFGEMEKLAIVSVDTPQNACDSIGKELVLVKEIDTVDSESRDISTENPSNWLQNVVQVISEETHVSKRRIDEILEDVRVALKNSDQLGTEMENQLGESELARLQLELEDLQESKRLVENQLENQKLINDDLDKQLTVSKVQSNELLQNLSSLEVELEDKSHYCEELEATCLELHVHLESVSKKEVTENNENHDEEFFQTGQSEGEDEIPIDSKKIVVCQETILNLGEQLKALNYSKQIPSIDKVLSRKEDKTSTLHASLRDRILAEEGVNFVVDDPSSPQTKEIIHHSSNGQSFLEVGTNGAGALTIVTNTKRKSGGISLLRKLMRRKSKKKMSLSLSRGRSL